MRIDRARRRAATLPSSARLIQFQNSVSPVTPRLQTMLANVLQARELANGVIASLPLRYSIGFDLDVEPARSP